MVVFVSKQAHWYPTSTGFTLVDGPVEATLTLGKKPFVTIAGVDYPLGKRASFDHADAIVLASL